MWLQLLGCTLLMSLRLYFSKGSDLDGEDKSKPRFGVAKMISLGVQFYGSEVKVGLG